MKHLIALFLILSPLSAFAFNVGDLALVTLPSCANTYSGAGFEVEYIYDPDNPSPFVIFKSVLNADNVLYYYTVDPDEGWYVGLLEVSAGWGLDTLDTTDPTGTYDLWFDHQTDCTDETASVVFVPAPIIPPTSEVRALGLINFGLSIIIVLAFIGFIGYLFNLMKKKKAWR